MSKYESGGIAVVIIAVLLVGLALPCLVVAGGAAFWLLVRSEPQPMPPNPPVEWTVPTVAQDNLSVVCEITAMQLGVDAAEIQPSTSLGDLGADELDLVEIVMALEDHFGIQIPDDAIVEVTGSDTWAEGHDHLTMLRLVEIVEGQRLDGGK